MEIPMNFNEKHFAFTTVADSEEDARQRTEAALRDVGVNDTEMSWCGTDEIADGLWQTTMKVNTAYMVEFETVLDRDNGVEDIEEVAVVEA